MAERQKFWTTWPGAVVMGLIALVVALPGAAAALAWLLLPSYDSSGIDFVIAPPSTACPNAFPALLPCWPRQRWPFA